MHKKIWILIISFILICLYSYVMFPLLINYGLFYDDFPIAEKFKSFNKSIFEIGYLLRPIPRMFFIVYNTLGNFNLYGHISNIIINSLTILFSLIVILKIISKNGQINSHGIIYSFLFFLSYTIHISTTYNILWVSGIQTLLGGFFTVLSILFLFKYIEKKIAINLIAIYVAYILSIFSYENSLSLIFIIPIIYFCLEDKLEKSSIKHLCYLFIGLFSITSIYFAIRLFYHKSVVSKFHGIKRLIIQIGEYLFAIINGIDRPLFYYWIRFKGKLSSFEIILVSLTGIASLSLLLLILIITKHANKSKFNKAKAYLLLFALLFLTVSPILYGRAGFPPRLAYSQIFFFGLALAILTKNEKKKMILAIIALLLIFIFAIYSQIAFYKITKIVITNRSSYINTILDNFSRSNLINVIGVSPATYYDFPVVILPEERFRYEHGIKVYSTELGLYVLNHPFMKKDSIAELITCTKISLNSYCYTVCDNRSYIKEKTFMGRYKMGQTFKLGFATFTITKIDSRGFITQFELYLPNNTNLTDYDFWAK